MPGQWGGEGNLSKITRFPRDAPEVNKEKNLLRTRRHSLRCSPRHLTTKKTHHPIWKYLNHRPGFRVLLKAPENDHFLKCLLSVNLEFCKQSRKQPSSSLISFHIYPTKLQKEPHMYSVIKVFAPQVTLIFFFSLKAIIQRTSCKLVSQTNRLAWCRSDLNAKRCSLEIIFVVKVVMPRKDQREQSCR